MIPVVSLVGVPQGMAEFGNTNAMGPRMFSEGALVSNPIYHGELLGCPLVVLLQFALKWFAMECMWY